MTARRARHAALSAWRQMVAGEVGEDGPDLSARQWAILLHVYLETAPHTVRGLSAALVLGKPAVTRALSTLERLGLVRRAPDPADRRSIHVQRTVRGSVYLTEAGERMAQALNAYAADARKQGDEEDRS